MKITKNCVTRFDYTLTDDEGNVIDSSDGDQPLTYIHGYSMIVPGLENAMEGKSAGDTFKIRIQPGEGYGERNDNLMQEVPKSHFSGAGEVKVGMQFQASAESDDCCGKHTVIVRVVEIGPETVTIDGNHPLAGQNLNFAISVVDVREATSEELEHGHAHEGESECGSDCGHHH